MKLLCTILSLFLMAACGHANAESTNTPTITVEYLQQDSVRVVARWSRPCDAKGCADSYRVQWTVGAVARLRSIAVLADTLYTTRPAIGDSVLATVGVTSMRRGIAGATRTGTGWLRNPDAPPPAVDSLRVDTLSSVYEAAMLDSFPVLVIRDTLGQVPPPVIEMTVDTTSAPFGFMEPIQKPPQRYVFCVLGRNRYTGAVMSFVGPDESDESFAELDAACANARAAYAGERSG